jgi:UDP-N-acetylmuramyl pentapeptide phosphotransferase/UDP-N-acetylglucosamine-1-phosphate transferase
MKVCAELRSIICNSNHELLLLSKEWGVTLLSLAGFVFFLAWWGTSRLCRRTSKLFLLDHPNPRSLHAVPTPRTGGVAILGSLFFGLIAAGVFGLLVIRETLSSSVWDHLEGWILTMTLLVALVSFVDDRRGVPVWIRLGCQLTTSAILTIGAGLLLPSVQLPIYGAIEFGWLEAPITILFLVWMSNLYNFMDGMDGFAGGMTVIGCGFMAYFAWMAGHEFILVSALLLSLASAGFLVHNLPPARIFMGDVGSIAIGFLCGALTILGCQDGVFDFWVPLILFSPFILDATVTLIRRVLQREKIWVAHRTHYYQRLVLSGWGHRKAVLAEYAVMALCGGLALFYQYVSEEWRLVILGAWGVVFLFFAIAVKGVERRTQPVGS